MPGKIYITRYKLQAFRESNVTTLKMHGGASIIHVDEIGVGNKGDFSKPEFDTFLWAVVNSHEPVEERRFWLVRDGDDLSALGEDPWQFHVGSWRSVNGTLWQHLFEITHVPDYVPPKRERKGGRWQSSRQKSSTKIVSG